MIKGGKIQEDALPDFGWIIKMAFRDFRNISRLMLFVFLYSSWEIAALVAISSFGEILLLT